MLVQLRLHMKITTKSFHSGRVSDQYHATGSKCVFSLFSHNHKPSSLLANAQLDRSSNYPSEYKQALT